MGSVGWLIMLIYIVTWDCMASETLSDAFYKAVQHPFHKWWVILVWVVITLHLFKLISKRYDLVHIVTDWVKGWLWVSNVQCVKTRQKWLVLLISCTYTIALWLKSVSTLMAKSGVIHRITYREQSDEQRWPNQRNRVGIKRTRCRALSEAYATPLSSSNDWLSGTWATAVDTPTPIIETPLPMTSYGWY